VSMTDPHAARATQLLADFLAVVSSLPDAPTALEGAVERAAQALDAEVAAVVSAGRARTSVGFPTDRIPHEALAQVAAGERRTLDIPGAGLGHAMAVPLRGSLDGHLVVARSGDEAFGVDEISLMRAMARVMELTFDMLRTLEAERLLRDRSERQAAENATLLTSLRERQRLLERLSEIQRSISRREPLTDILDAITSGLHDLLGDDIVVFRRSDGAGASDHRLVSTSGGTEELAQWLARAPMPDQLAPGREVRAANAVHRYEFTAGPARGRNAEQPRVRTAIATTVHENGTVVGSLVVGSCDEHRQYSEAECATLFAFADHASLAVTDANTLEAMYRAFHDSLTGLASRALFLDRLQHGLVQAARARHSLTLLFIDLDRFKMVNDTLGHDVGDRLLIEVAERLRGCLRASDTAARFGGDEFVVLLHNTTADDATLVADRIIHAVRAPFAADGMNVFVDASIGIAASDAGAVGADELLRNADVAMYRAKRAGRGRHAMYEPEMRAVLVDRLQLEADLRGALDRGEMAVHYQPIVALSTGETTGVEALLRWNHPIRGLLVPADFIAIAEECGALISIGMWVLREATAQVRRWHDQLDGHRPLTVSVNISARQLEQPTLCADVASAIAASGLPASSLILEITEALILSDEVGTLARLHELKALGVQLAIDDFGAGYSSPAALRRFPLDIVKIDRSFVDGIGTSSEASAFAWKIIELAHTLDLQVIAEGVQNYEQLDELRRARCELAQGYYFAEPCRADQLPDAFPRLEEHGRLVGPIRVRG